MTNSHGLNAFHADHVGSLIRPKPLQQARIAYTKGQLSLDELRRLEDECVGQAVAMQERVGLSVITDGEFRRGNWNEVFVNSVEGYGDDSVEGSFVFTLDDGSTRKPMPIRAVSGKLKRRRGLVTDQFLSLKGVTDRVAKVTAPAPSQAYVNGGDRMLAKVRSIYPDRQAYMSDVAAIYREEIAELGRLGCKYLQLDEVALAVCCDPRNLELIRHRGEDPNAVIDLCIDTLKDALRDRPRGMRINLHMCRGNDGQGMASGGYEPIAERLFSEIDVDGFLLEYDTERAGDFQPLRHVSKGKTVALGIVSTKNPEIETVAQLRARIDKAARHIDLKQLALCPQCGFGTVFNHQTMTIEQEALKLSRMVEVAREVWGTS